MNSSTKSNMYSVARDTVLVEYAAYVQPVTTPCSFLFCVVCARTPSSAVIEALSSSAQALGYQKAACFFVSTLRDSAERLGPPDLFRLIEGIDPLVLIAADKEAAEELGQAYRDAQGPHLFERDKYQRILGRDAVVFSSFEALLEKPEDKQKAWSLLKKLPKIG